MKKILAITGRRSDTFDPRVLEMIQYGYDYVDFVGYDSRVMLGLLGQQIQRGDQRHMAEISLKKMAEAYNQSAHWAEEQKMEERGRIGLGGKYVMSREEQAWALRYLLKDEFHFSHEPKGHEWDTFFAHTVGTPLFYSYTFSKVAQHQHEALLYGRHHETCTCIVGKYAATHNETHDRFLVGCKCPKCYLVHPLEVLRHIYIARGFSWPKETFVPGSGDLRLLKPTTGRWSCTKPNLSNAPKPEKPEPKFGNPILDEEVIITWAGGSETIAAIKEAGLASLLRPISDKPGFYHPHPKLRAAYREYNHLLRTKQTTLEKAEFFRRQHLLEPEPRRLQTTTWDPGYGDD